jgi:hypothetical protein
VAGRLSFGLLDHRALAQIDQVLWVRPAPCIGEASGAHCACGFEMKKRPADVTGRE